MSSSTFTQLHVVISLVGLVTGIVVLVAMLKGYYARNWTEIFLFSTTATSVTGFMFHSTFGPPHVFGIISLVALAFSIAAVYLYKFEGSWRQIYVASATLALYLNCFVAVVQTFQKVAFFHELAPTPAAPAFAIAQGLLLIAFLVIGVLAAKHFRPTPAASASQLAH